MAHRPADPLCPERQTHTPEQVAQVAASMQQFGWTNPILVAGDNVILAGHARCWRRASWGWRRCR